jgi:hypothetical protein
LFRPSAVASKADGTLAGQTRATAGREPTLRILTDLLFLLTVFGFVSTAVLQWELPPLLGAICFVALVGIRLWGRISGGGLSHVVRLTFLIGLPIASLMLFAATIERTGFPPTLAPLFAALVLAVAVYVLVGGRGRQPPAA